MALLKILKEAKESGSSMEKSCTVLQVSSRKVRRWQKEKVTPRPPAWNRIMEEERKAIIDTAWDENNAGLPLSHLYVNGHKSGNFHVSLSTLFRVLKKEDLVQPRKRRKRGSGYISVQTLLKEGWSILCYDGTCFRTEAGMQVWGIPILLLPFRYLLSVGISMGSFSGEDLRRTVESGIERLPTNIKEKLLVHSDRGSQMKSRATRRKIEELLNVSVHFGRPHVKDDHAWIEALNKTMKYHRDCPESFRTVLSIQNWLESFPEIYNNEPHSTLGYVTPKEALLGMAEEILNTRKQNLQKAREARLAAYWRSKKHD